MYVHLEKLWVDSLQHTRKYNFFFCRICPLEFFIVFNFKNDNKFQWANGTATRLCYVANESTPCLFWLL